MEAMAGSKPGFCFVPVRVDDKELPLFARNRVFLDFTAYPDGPNGGELLRLLHAIVGQALSEASMRFAAELDRQTQEAASLIKAARKNGDAHAPPTPVRKGRPALGDFRDPRLPGRRRIAQYRRAAGGARDAAADRATVPPRHPPEAAPRAGARAARRRGQSEDRRRRSSACSTSRNERDPETLGIYARTFMDRYAASGNVSDAPPLPRPL